MTRFYSKDFRRDAPINSQRWASTDRGWVYDNRHPDRELVCERSIAIGNYLDYGPCGEHYASRPGGSVHACCTPWRYDPVTGNIVRPPGESAWFTSVKSAKRWIEARQAEKVPLTYDEAFEELLEAGFEPVPGSSAFRDARGRTGRIVALPGSGDTFRTEVE